MPRKTDAKHARPPAPRKSKPQRRIDDAIRDQYDSYATEDEKLLQALPHPDDFTRSDTWRVLRIMGEFIEGFDKLANVGKSGHGVRFGANASGRSAVPGGRGGRETPRRSGLRDDHRLGPRDHGSREQGREARGRPQHRLQHRAAVRAGREPVRRYGRELPLLLRAEDDVHQVQRGVRHLSRRLRHARRAVRGDHADPDGEDLAVPGDAVRHALLGGAGALAAVARARRKEDLRRATST